MRHIVPAILLIVGLIHALPVAGVMGSAALSRLYGIDVSESNLELLMRHRAVLFGLLACFMGYAAFTPALHRLALIAGLVSVASFLLLAPAVVNSQVHTVVRADWLALGLLLVGCAVHWTRP